MRRRLLKQPGSTGLQNSLPQAAGLSFLCYQGAWATQQHSDVVLERSVGQHARTEQISEQSSSASHGFLKYSRVSTLFEVSVRLVLGHRTRGGRIPLASKPATLEQSVLRACVRRLYHTSRRKLLIISVLRALEQRSSKLDIAAQRLSASDWESAPTSKQCSANARALSAPSQQRRS